MKRLIVLLILCISSLAYADINKIEGQIIAGGGATCSTSTDEILISQYTASSNFSISLVNWVGKQITLASAKTLTGITVSIRDDGAADSFYVEIWTDSSGEPGSLVTGFDVAISNTLIAPSTFNEVFFEFGTPAELGVGTYHIVLRSEGSGLFSFERNGASASSGDYHWSPDQGANWTFFDRDIWFEVWGCP